MERGRYVLVGVAAVLLIALGACALLPEKVSVGIGTAAYLEDDAPAYAKLYRPYAQMSALAYANRVTPAGCPDKTQLRNRRLAKDADEAKYNLNLVAWQNQIEGEGWQCLFGQIGYDACRFDMRCVEGLGFQVWMRKCTEAVIAFRGSDARDFGDLVSNLRWFVVNPYFDQYRQVHALIVKTINRIGRDVRCRPRRIIATGHSLGGGLAQHAAYAAGGRIGYVYAFDPSPITGYFDVPWEERMHTVERFGIDRIYQAGEILSLPRYFVSGIFPTPTCRPRVRIVRFATIQSSSLFERHKIEQLTAGLLQLERLARSSPVPDDYTKPLTCTFSPPPDLAY